MKLKTLLLTATAVAALTGTARAGDWYVGLEGGANWIRDEKFVFDGGPLVNTKFKAGWGAFGTVGYDWGHLRTELELGYRHNNIDFFDSVPTSSGKFDEFSAMANAVWDIPVSSRLDLSLGAGLGADNIMYESKLFHPLTIDDTDWVFAWQLIAGLNFHATSNIDVVLNYRYFNAVDPEFSELQAGAPPVLHSDAYEDVNKHTLTLGLRYSFGYTEPATPPPAPMPPPPPPPAAPRQFIVFFGFSKCNITAEADAVLSEAASAAKSTGSASISIVGHTDTVGSPKANQKLSECRAEAAKSNLVGKGIPAGAIGTTGKGESELMVQTGDNVKEPQNRRATVDLN